VNRMNYVQVNEHNIVMRSGYGPDHDVTPLLTEPGFYLAGTGEYGVDKGKVLNPETLQLNERSPLALTFNETTVTADGVDSIVMTDLPAGAVVIIRGPVTHNFVHGGGNLELEFTVPGSYDIDIESLPNAITRYTIEAVE
jgi:hypothetical protein